MAATVKTVTPSPTKKPAPLLLSKAMEPTAKRNLGSDFNNPVTQEQTTETGLARPNEVVKKFYFECDSYGFGQNRRQLELEHELERAATQNATDGVSLGLEQPAPAPIVPTDNIEPRRSSYMQMSAPQKRVAEHPPTSHSLFGQVQERVSHKPWYNEPAHLCPGMG